MPKYKSSTLTVGNESAPKVRYDEASTGGKLGTERVTNVMGSTAGAGSDEFHLYRASRRTEMLRLEKMDKSAEEQALDLAFAQRQEERRLECEARTAKNAEKRQRKKRRKAFANDGSFLEKAKQLLEAKGERGE